MATVAVSKPADSDQVHARTLLWEGLNATDLDGAAVEIPDHADRCVQVVGTFDTGTVTMQGSNDGTTWAPLTDPQGNAIAFTAAGIEQIMENTRYVRPLLSSAGGSTDLDVYLHARQNR